MSRKDRVIFAGLIIVGSGIGNFLFQAITSQNWEKATINTLVAMILIEGWLIYKEISR